jgi:hypothetical protein
MIDDHRTKPNQRVRLKGDGCDGYYPWATSGSEGWVRKQSFDHGFPMIYVEWDKEHWTYNGEQDQWTFENHFYPIAKGQNMSDKNMVSKEDFLKAVNQLFETSDEDESETQKVDRLRAGQVAEQHGEGVPEEDEQWPSVEKYNQVLDDSIKEARDAEAFLIVTVTREDVEAYDDGLLVPKVTNVYQSPESAILLEVQLSKLALLAHEGLAMHKIYEVLDEDE